MTNNMIVVPQNDPNSPYGSLCKFKVEKRIGKGQFSEVWRAEVNATNEIIALKKVQVGIYFCR